MVGQRKGHGMGHEAWAWGQTTGEHRWAEEDISGQRKAWGMGHEAWGTWGQIGRVGSDHRRGRSCQGRVSIVRGRGSRRGGSGRGPS